MSVIISRMTSSLCLFMQGFGTVSPILSVSSNPVYSDRDPMQDVENGKVVYGECEGKRHLEGEMATRTQGDDIFPLVIFPPSIARTKIEGKACGK
jgi:hypothetical protein